MSTSHPEEKVDDFSVPDIEMASSKDDSSAANVVPQDKKKEFRRMTWQKAAWLLAGDQVCLAIMAQSWSLSVLGWVPGILTMVIVGGFFYITSLTMHKYIMTYPEIKNICDFAYFVFGQSDIAYKITAIMLLLNNILLIGFHILTGAKVLNTLSNHSTCTVIFAIIATTIGIILSIPRTLRHVSQMSIFSAIFMAVAILLSLVFAGTEDHPLYGYNGVYPEAGPVKTYAFPLEGTTFVAIMNAILNITFLWVPQILFPSFIAEMKRPEDFPKALSVLAVLSTVLFIVPPAIGFHFLGQYATAPAFASLGSEVHRKVSFGFVIVPTIVIGVIYANVTAKLFYNHIMRKSSHARSNTAIGWSVWVGIVSVIWILGFIFAEVIPSMGDFLSLLGAAFDSFFGFIYFAIAYYVLHKGELFKGVWRSLSTVTHVLVMICGLFLLGPGLYAAVQAVINDYSSTVSPAFSCDNVAI